MRSANGRSELFLNHYTEDTEVTQRAQRRLTTIGAQVRYKRANRRGARVILGVVLELRLSGGGRCFVSAEPLATTRFATRAAATEGRPPRGRSLPRLTS